MVIFTPYITFLSSRFIIQSMVEDKNTKMKESLKLMSLSRTAYASSYFIMQAVMAIFSGVIVGALVFGNKAIWPGDDQER